MSHPPGTPALQEAAGIHCLPLPTPFAVGRVNTYLIDDEPLTLVDSGPNSGKSLDELELALGRIGHAIEDIELVVLTHQHIDHVGLAAIIARRSGAAVAGLDRLAPLLARHSEEQDSDDRLAGTIMRRHGIPEDIVAALRAVSASFRAWGSSVEITRPLTDGGLLELRDRTFQVLHRPGHSPSDTLFHDDRRGLLLAGDHLIKHISSNPLISLPLGGELPDGPEAGDHGSRPQALVAYLASMRATRELDLELVLAGHGEPIFDHVALIDERIRMHERRAEKILGLIRAEPRSAYEIAQAMWGNVAVTQAFLTLSEVLGHADLLLNNGSIVERVGARVVQFEAV